MVYGLWTKECFICMKNKLIVGIVIILGFAVIGFLLARYNFFIGNAVSEITELDAKEFTVHAFKFGYSPDIIEVNRGDRIRIMINNTDDVHGMRIPDLNIRGNDIIEFTADKTGEFNWYCANMCGSGHMQMQGKLIVK